MLRKWNEIDLPGVKAINTRYALAHLHNWESDFEVWESAKLYEIERYEQMLTDIEDEWLRYGDDVQDLYDAAKLCYLLLGGHMVGINRNEEIARLTKIYYKSEC